MSERKRVKDTEAIIQIPTYVDENGTYFLDTDNAYTQNSSARWALKKENDR